MVRPTEISAVVVPGSTMTGPITPVPPSLDEDAAAELDVVLSEDPPHAVRMPAPPRARTLAAAMVIPRRAVAFMWCLRFPWPLHAALQRIDGDPDPPVPHPFG